MEVSVSFGVGRLVGLELQFCIVRPGGTKEKICPVEVDSPKRKHGDGQKTCLNIGVLL